MSQSFNALIVKETGNGSFLRSIQKWNVDDLPENDVLIRIRYSSLNYKDALSASGNQGVTKNYPHIPGIDAAGVVEESRDERFSPGDTVLVTGYDLGQNTFGGFSEYIRVPADWIVPLPEGLTLRESMILGTAGFTAAIGVHHLQSNGVQSEDGEVLVTGATGGVGTLAVAILSKIGYKVVAATGKMDQKDFLHEIGADSVIHRDEVQDASSKLLLASRWAGGIDTVGGIMLDTAIRQTKHNGTVACCGNVLGAELHTNVYPFILRGISLMGIDSGNCLMSLRKALWQKLAADWKPEQLNLLAKEVSLGGLNEEIERILQGKQVGRVVVNLA
ncbi:MAG TPA: YhdH/YhfP family quinone oxidoreductase [Balneolaceae bacterium]|nr:YhdH/YhfP family quinone oxidoreductase [Balneolaceae bacterium]